jgi:ABC-2 type transport system permease protein
LNLLYLALMVAWFHHTFNVCKERGSLVRIGE